MLCFFHFKQLNDNLDNFSNSSSSDMHYTLMIQILKVSIAEKFMRSPKLPFQNESPKLSYKNLEFQKLRFLFFKQNNLNLP